MSGNGSGKRLPSFKTQRDLSLGASSSKTSSTAKKFVPNLNVRRKGESNADDIPKDSSGGPTSKKNGSSKKKETRREPPPKPNLIQTTSVFSEGIVPSTKPSSKGGSGSSGSHSGDRSRSTTVVKEFDRGESEAEKERLKNLLRDDFIEDSKIGGTPPIQLPMINTGSMFKGAEEEVKIKIEGGKKQNAHRILDEDDKLSISAAKTPPSSSTNIRDLIQSEDLSQLFLVQMPDVLPGGQSFSTLSSEGRLGTIQVRASGATRLLLENGDELDLEIGTQVGFLQNAVSLQHESPLQDDEEEGGEDSPPKAGNMTALGQVNQRLVMTPSWEALLKKAGNEDDS
eukprot:TRINITY_DN7875_c0_g1_i1.p1 TRINITY_DN7875_c0_g1~~TRINITY_DN7875_c0_g1_i1.p1  ORF type:complete len:341 (-),score=118.41 TRINITY_DN7875_c0_g1_i1:20-1042(-)